MDYNTLKEFDVKRLMKRIMFLIKHNRLVRVIDITERSLQQNAYMHVLIRIVAFELGVKEYECKQAFFKKMANRDIFLQKVVDPSTGEEEEIMRSSSSLTITEMSKAIENFITWAEQHDIILPEALSDEEGNLIFASEGDKEAYFDAINETSKYEKLLNNNQHE